MRLNVNRFGFDDLFEDEDPFKGVSKEDLAARGLDSKGNKLPDDEIIGEDTIYKLFDIESAELLTWFDLGEDEWEQLDYVQDQEGMFFRYGGNIFDLGEFIRTPDGGDLKRAGWDGMNAQSYYNGYVVKFNDSNDGVIVARITWVAREDTEQ